jgi:hypothetical protein
MLPTICEFKLCEILQFLKEVFNVKMKISKGGGKSLKCHSPPSWSTKNLSLLNMTLQPTSTNFALVTWVLNLFSQQMQFVF